MHLAAALRHAILLSAFHFQLFLSGLIAFSPFVRDSGYFPAAACLLKRGGKLRRLS